MAWGVNELGRFDDLREEKVKNKTRISLILLRCMLERELEMCM